MSFWIYFGVYTFSMILIWGFFIIAKIHSLKFKSYQPKIIKITHIANIVMIILTLLGYLFIILRYSGIDEYSLEDRGSIKNNISEFQEINTNRNIRDDFLNDYY